MKININGTEIETERHIASDDEQPVIKPNRICEHSGVEWDENGKVIGVNP